MIIKLPASAARRGRLLGPRGDLEQVKPGRSISKCMIVVAIPRNEIRNGNYNKPNKRMFPVIDSTCLAQQTASNLNKTPSANAQPA